MRRKLLRVVLLILKIYKLVFIFIIIVVLQWRKVTNLLLPTFIWWSPTSIISIEWSYIYIISIEWSYISIVPI